MAEISPALRLNSAEITVVEVSENVCASPRPVSTDILVRNTSTIYGRSLRKIARVLQHYSVNRSTPFMWSLTLKPPIIWP